MKSKYQTLNSCLTQFLSTYYIAKNPSLFFAVLIVAVRVVFCANKRQYDGAVGGKKTTTLSQADLEVGLYIIFPPTVRVHHCLGCTSQKWQQRVTLKGPGVQLPENVTGLALTERHTGRWVGCDKNNNLKAPQISCTHTHTHTHTHTRTRSWKCAYALLLLPSITQMHSSFRCHFILSIQTAERINVSSISVFFLNIMIDWIFVGGWTVLAEKNGQKRQQISRCHLQSEWPFFSVGSCIKNTYLIDQKNSRQINKWWCTSVVCCSLMILHSFLFMQ